MGFLKGLCCSNKSSEELSRGIDPAMKILKKDKSYKSGNSDSQGSYASHMQRLNHSKLSSAKLSETENQPFEP